MKLGLDLERYVMKLCYETALGMKDTVSRVWDALLKGGVHAPAIYECFPLGT